MNRNKAKELYVHVVFPLVILVSVIIVVLGLSLLGRVRYDRVLAEGYNHDLVANQFDVAVIDAFEAISGQNLDDAAVVEVINQMESNDGVVRLIVVPLFLLTMYLVVLLIEVVLWSYERFHYKKSYTEVR